MEALDVTGNAYIIKFRNRKITESLGMAIKKIKSRYLIKSQYLLHLFSSSDFKKTSMSKDDIIGVLNGVPHWRWRKSHFNLSWAKDLF